MINLDKSSKTVNLTLQNIFRGVSNTFTDFTTYTNDLFSTLCYSLKCLCLCKRCCGKLVLFHSQINEKKTLLSLRVKIFEKHFWRSSFLLELQGYFTGISQRFCQISEQLFSWHLLVVASASMKEFIVNNLAAL